MRLSEEELARELRAARPEIDPGFAAKLDEWAAAGFPPAKRPGWGSARETLGDRLAGLRARLAATPPRKLLMPVGAAATLIVVVGIAVSQVGTTKSPQTFTAGGTEDATGVAAQPSPRTDDQAASAAREKAVPESLRAGNDAAAVVKPGGGAGSAAPGRTRHVAQNVDMVLASEPENVREVADGVNGVVNQYRGFVVNSSVQSGDAEQNPGAHFRLRIPAGKLQAALADLSELAHVQSRTEGTEDITSRFVSAQERIDENETARDKLLQELEDAVTAEEIASIRAQLRIVNAQLAAARNDLAEAQQRVHLVPVTVSIVAEEGADADNGGWSVGDAIDDAGDVLSTIAGIAIVAGAVLLPLALIGALFALAWRVSANRGRERALDD
jgi:Domain of unknown function (DUF4349)